MSVNKRLIGAGATDTGGGGGAITPTNHFDTLIWTGTGSARQISGLNFQPDLVWYKERSNTSSHEWLDSTRGATNYIMSNSDNAQATSAQGLQSFDSSGFSVGNDGAVNQNGETYVAWCWHANGGNTSSNTNGTITSTVQANDAAGFSIVKYVGDGNSARTVGHGLSAKCDLVIIKIIDQSDKWIIQTPQLGDNARTVFVGAPAVTNDSTTAQAGNDTVFGIGGDNSVNKSGDNHIAYCFRNISGYQKIGTYTGNGSATGPTIDLGFEPAFLMIKRSSSTGNWLIFDNKRSTTNTRDKLLFANDSAAEQTLAYVDFLSNGFQIVAAGGTGDTNININGSTYLYWAIAGAAADVTPTVEESLAVENWGGSDYAKNIMNNFRAGLVITRAKGEAHHWGWFDIVRGVGEWLQVNSNSAQQQGSYGPSAYNAKNTEFYGNFTPSNSDYLNETYNGWFIKAAENTVSNSNGSITSDVSANAAAGFSIVKYTGTGANASVGHGLSSAPELIFIKKYSASADWVAGVSDWTKYLEPNGTPPFRTANVWQNTAPTSTVFTLATSGDTNGNGDNMIAYCWHSVTGFSKVGSYTGTGSLQTIVTGFTPDFIIIKNTTDTDNWAVFSSYDLGMSVNSFDQTQAQQSFNNSTMFSQSNGFQVPSSSGMTNGSGKNYIYLAMKKNVTQDNTTQYNFNIKLYDGNAAANHYIDGFDFRPDLAIVKPYNATGQWSWFDSVRGAGNRLDSTETSQAVQNGDTLQSFAFDGFTFGNESGNNNGEGNVAYGWRAGRTWLVNNDGNITSLANANQSAGFSIVKYQGTANGSAKTIGHGLSSAPEFVIIKDYEWSTPSWFVYHKDLSNTNQYLQLNSNSAEATASTVFGAAPTSSVINVGNDSGVGDRADNYIAYCFHSVSGKRKIGTYTGNGLASGTVVQPGFSPDFVMVKRVDSTSNWGVFDSKRGGSYYQKGLLFNNTASQYAETDSNSACEFLAAGHGDAPTGGFRFRDSSSPYNVSSGTYIYWAEKIH
tara:strand:+ start:2306 stop:5344 length:3039 start_codon:yes stop_codon:yes gene_type:complete